jgi:hypothetical protein
MRFKQYINELWIKPFGKKIEVLEIPPDQMSDINDMEITSGLGIRFTAIKKTKKLYIWNAYDANHQYVWEKIWKSRYTSLPNTKSLQGQAVKIGGKWEMSTWDDYEYLSYENRENLDVDITDIIKSFKWVNTYINIDKILKRFRGWYD